jgi:hypothetical protein
MHITKIEILERVDIFLLFRAHAEHLTVRKIYKTEKFSN